ncbi:hypothetical protein CR164_05730 [Prosthecochloris marina]|uniref:Uncharacterized protein n=1 Tax=Prosthecochloris marina TaxID=2017681 RepID=A0A317T7I5_9CHLB|nr:hypothetical protein [Prosthecochloris marina]PWW82488.1 hypothetical protein CR164_05730 [Prosthecochloris marina]
MKQLNKTINPEERSAGYSYEFSVVPGGSSRTIKVVVTEGELKGKSALVIKMPDKFSGFFPKIDRSFFSKE